MSIGSIWHSVQSSFMKMKWWVFGVNRSKIGNQILLSLADPKGHLHLGPISLIFMQFLSKSCKIIGFCLKLKKTAGILDPPLIVPDSLLKRLYTSPQIVVTALWTVGVSGGHSQWRRGRITDRQAAPPITTIPPTPRPRERSSRRRPEKLVHFFTTKPLHEKAG